MGVNIAQYRKEKNIKDLVKPWLFEAEEYNFTDIKDGIRLHLNESPFPTPEFIIEEVKKVLDKGNRYQHPELLEELRLRIADYANVEKENVFVSTGADNCIRILFNTLLLPYDLVVFNYPSYGMYPVFSSFRGNKVVRVNMIEGEEWWNADFDKILEASKSAKLVIIDDPNNPTGSPIFRGRLDILKELLELTNGFVVIDEAYYEFSGYTVVPLINEYPNLIIVRTLSKAFSLASYRVGYIIANSELIKLLMKGFTPFEIPLPSMIAAITALSNPSYSRNVVEEIVKNREYLKQGLRKLGFKVFNSLTNFLLVKSSINL
ncbi:MAG: histidinol-phosphate transaminase, partial [Sulfolobaceae archaeon]